MEEKEKRAPIKKIELHRLPVVTCKKSTECIPVPSSELDLKKMDSTMWTPFFSIF